MIEDVVPIIYMNGTGGNFLCHFIVSAKRNIKDIIQLSKHGNAHEHGLKDIPHPTWGIRIPDIDKINHIKEYVKNIENNLKPYYTSAHISDIDLVNSYFKKHIKITYDMNDVNELVPASLGKFHVDTQNKNKEDLPKYLADITWITMKYNKFFKNSDKENTLCISWKELYHLDPAIIIDKLNLFTNIPKENFSIEQLLIWRDATKKCIETVTNILKEKS